MNREEEILHIFPEGMRAFWTRTAIQYDRLQEIRMRAGRPVLLIIENQEVYLSQEGSLQKEPCHAYCMKEEELHDILNHICHYSLYAFEDEMKQGFLTIPGGHRVGIAGQIVLGEDDQVRSIKHIRYMNIRIAHQIKGAADKVLPMVYENGRIANILIVSPPGCGKTTLLRDIIRQVSDGNSYGKGVSVGVVDERSEIAGSFMGIPQNDVGMRTDVLDACPKVLGMMMLIRSMAPKVIAIDELGCQEDMQALWQIYGCGCSMIVTVHGEGMEDIRQKSYLKSAVQEHLFDRYIVLHKKDNQCAVQGIYDTFGHPIEEK